MNLLEEITRYKRSEVQKRQSIYPVSELESMLFYRRKCHSLKNSLQDTARTGIIAEFKRCSPSRGVINQQANVRRVTAGYAEHRASGLSILTDSNFFGGTSNDILAARTLSIPILRKDFIIDPYQVIESKAIGADVILLIAAILTKKEAAELTSLAHSLGLEVLLEIHSSSELEYITDEIDIVGVNNRDLRTFSVSLDTSIQLSEAIPAGKIKISESGINGTEDIFRLKEYGYNGFLIGEKFMKQTNPGEAFKEFATALKQPV